MFLQNTRNIFHYLTSYRATVAQKLYDGGVGVQVLIGSKNVTSLCHPDWFWCLPSLIINEYWRPFLWGYSGRGMKLTN
jgi:hypothetical protein